MSDQRARQADGFDFRGIRNNTHPDV